jgi:HEAT repeat protein
LGRSHLAVVKDDADFAPLLDALNDDSPSMRVLVIYALEDLNAREAVPRLVALLNDQRKSNFGAQVTVADAAKAAIAALQ